MEANADFSQRASAHTSSNPWVPSPLPGVERRMLDRIGDEVARATTIVRFAPGSAFAAHTHGGGEEYLVLEGVFQDEDGDFPVGTYVRNPPTTRHTPSSEKGATILVKLWQFDPDDRTSVRIETTGQDLMPVPGRAGVSEIPLFEDDNERVRIEVWDAQSDIRIDAHDGFELLVLEGDFEEAGETFTKHSWLRLPAGQPFVAKTGSEGARVWIKTGHLSVEPKAPAG